MQPELSLLYREEEREMLPLCRDQGVGVIPWSPLARGRLAWPWGQATPRIDSDAFGKTLFAHTEDNDREIAAALAWVLARPGVTAPIGGASRPKQLADAVAALSLHLGDDEQRALPAPYRPHPAVGFLHLADGVAAMGQRPAKRPSLSHKPPQAATVRAAP